MAKDRRLTSEKISGFRKATGITTAAIAATNPISRH